MSLLSPPCWEPVDAWGWWAVTGLTVADAACQRLAWELPRTVFASVLIREYGVGSLLLRTRGVGPSGAGPGQRAVLEALLRDASLGPGGEGVVVDEAPVPGDGVLRFLSPRRGGAEAEASLVRGRGLRRVLLERLPPRPVPVIAVDMGLVWRHTVEELRSLRVQLGAALGEVRRWLWDPHLLLAGLRPGVLEWLRGFLGSPLVQASTLPSDEALVLRGYRRIVLLDPSAPEPLAPGDVLGAEAFILGGIVDRTPRPGETARLPLRGYYVRRRLELRGSTHGVPNRINVLAAVILDARYRFCGDVEKAITANMSPRDARARAYVEISRLLRGRRERVPWSIYCRLRAWLPLSPRDFVRAVRMAGGVPPEEPPPSSCSGGDKEEQGRDTQRSTEG